MPECQLLAAYWPAWDHILRHSCLPVSSIGTGTSQIAFGLLDKGPLPIPNSSFLQGVPKRRPDFALCASHARVSELSSSFLSSIRLQAYYSCIDLFCISLQGEVNPHKWKVLPKQYNSKLVFRLKVEGSFYEEFKGPQKSTRKGQPLKQSERLAIDSGLTLEGLSALVQAAALSILGSAVNTSQSLVEAGLDSLGFLQLCTCLQSFFCKRIMPFG